MDAIFRRCPSAKEPVEKTVTEYDQELTAIGAGNTDIFFTYNVKITAKDSGIMNIRYGSTVYALYINGAYLKDYFTKAAAERGGFAWMKKDIAVKQAGSLPQPAAPETAYWLETCGGRPHLTRGTPEEWKRIEHFATKTKISLEVYEKAKSAFSLDWLGCFEEATIERWQQEFDAQTEAETMPEHTTVKPEKAAADRPMSAPKQPASRKKAVTAPEPPVQPAPYVNILPDSWIAACAGF